MQQIKSLKSTNQMLFGRVDFSKKSQAGHLLVMHVIKKKTYIFAKEP